MRDETEKSMLTSSASHVDKVLAAVGHCPGALAALDTFPHDSWRRCLHEYRLAPDHTARIPVLTQREFREKREALGERLFVALEEMTDLKTGIQQGQVALMDLFGEAFFSNFEVRTTPDAPWERHLPAMPPNTLKERNRP